MGFELLEESISGVNKFKAFRVDWRKGVEEREAAMRVAILDAEKELPEGTVFEIRAAEYPVPGKSVRMDYDRIELSFDEYAERWAVGWGAGDTVPLNSYYCLHHVDAGEKRLGYVLLARLMVKKDKQ